MKNSENVTSDCQCRQCKKFVISRNVGSLLLAAVQLESVSVLRRRESAARLEREFLGDFSKVFLLAKCNWNGFATF